MYAGRYWKPTRVDRVVKVMNTSTLPLLVVTDEGNALVKYMGNRQGPDALVTELLCAEIAWLVGLQTPDFAVCAIPSFEFDAPPYIRCEEGPAFFSRWVESSPLSQSSRLLANLRYPEQVSRLVVFDTWLKNKDRFLPNGAPNARSENMDNLLFSPDKRKTRMLVIDHTHALAETTLEDEMATGWAQETTPYGCFPQFLPYLCRNDVERAIRSVEAIDPAQLARLCDAVPVEWGLSTGLKSRICQCLTERAQLLRDWLPDALFPQGEFDFGNEEVER